ncbi:cytochrome [Sesamum angolense]|uniref:Cytochrome n=1 Tax=Sesamum angolense TaxID=2727404 RepID=A0AAE1VZS9_9LAMI|nr:cytochrome [Sesamum angolense]
MIAICAVCASFLLLPLTIIFYKLWWTRLHFQSIMESQGIKGPSYNFFHGNIKDIIKIENQTNSNVPIYLPDHDVFPRLQPHWYSWMKLYEKYLSTKMVYPKTEREGHLKKLLGDGIVVAEGEKWLKLRKLANHAFHGECLKDMVPAMVASVRTMLEKWRSYEGKEIEVCGDFRILSSEVISRTAFGSSYVEGIKIFDMLGKLFALVSKNAYKMKFLGLVKFVRTKDDREADKIEQLLHESIMEIVRKRQDEVITGRPDSFGSDFLGSLLKAHHEGGEKNQMSAAEIIDECKTFYFAGQLTTYSLLWTVLLLAIHTDWQEKARNEVLQLFGRENPNSEAIARMKTVNMIIHETLRLYSPVTLITRRTQGKVMLGRFKFPANFELVIPPLALHRNPDIWGPDAHLFKPERFAEGLAKATKGNPMAFLAFGSGPRTCVGLNFASYEVKIALSMILQRYKFTLSPNYVHSPFLALTVQPQHGAQILLQPL